MGDKLILRKIANILKLDFCLSLSKRAIQFGSRIVKYSWIISFINREYNTYMNLSVNDSKGDTYYRKMSEKEKEVEKGVLWLFSVCYFL